MTLKRIILLTLCALFGIIPSHAIRLRVNGGNMYESRNPFEYGRIVMGKNISTYSGGDLFEFNYSERKMSWKDYKGKSTYKMTELEHEGNMTIFYTAHHIVKVTQESNSYLVELVFKDGNQWLLLRLNCSEQ